MATTHSLYTGCLIDELYGLKGEKVYLNCSEFTVVNVWRK